jgi:hypothetical protein
MSAASANALRSIYPGQTRSAHRPRAARSAATGRNDQTVTDWSGPPPAARSSSTTAASSRLELRRYYSSHFAGLATPAQSRLGNGWRTGFDAVATWSGALASARHIHIMLPDFTELTYAFEGGVWRPKDSYEWTRPRTDVTATLTVNAGTVTLQQADGTRYLFNDKGQLSQIIARGGYTQTLTYAGNLNTLVTDSRGGWISFTYRVNGAASGLLALVRTSDRNSIHYQYEDRSQAGRKVKDQMTTGTNQWALKSVNNLVRGFPGTEYQYLDNTHRPFLITTVTNKPEKYAGRWTTSRFTYDVKKRVTSAERSPSGERWQYAYDDAANEVTVEGPNLPRVTYGFQRGAGGVMRLFSVDGHPVRPEPNLTPRGQSAAVVKQSGTQVCYEDCENEIRACTRLCRSAATDPDMPNIWGGAFGRCMRGCVSARCGGNKV